LLRGVTTAGRESESVPEPLKAGQQNNKPGAVCQKEKSLSADLGG